MKSNCTVLIVDDRSQARQGLKTLLATVPHAWVVGEARDGKEEIALADKHRPDVVLMGARIPVMDGPAAARRIKAE